MDPEYLILGHGNEVFQPYEERKKLLPGYRLLVLAECDMLTESASVDKIIELATAPILDVTKFRIFKEGDLYPSFNISLLSSIDIGPTTGGYDYTGISRSGIYSLPLEQDTFHYYDEYVRRYWRFDDEKRTAQFRYPGISLKIQTSRVRFAALEKSIVVNTDDIQKDAIDFMFLGSVFPPKKEMKEILLGSKTVDDLSNKLSFTIEEIFERLGPGTYIMPLCRAVVADAGDDEQDLFNFIAQEVEPELAEKLTLRQNKNRLKYRKQKLNMLNSLKNNPKLQEEPWKGKLNKVRKNLQRIIGTIQNTRAKSALKHRGVKQRKTRKATAS